MTCVQTGRRAPLVRVTGKRTAPGSVTPRRLHVEAAPSYRESEVTQRGKRRVAPSLVRAAGCSFRPDVLKGAQPAGGHSLSVAEDRAALDVWAVLLRVRVPV